MKNGEPQDFVLPREVIVAFPVEVISWPLPRHGWLELVLVHLGRSVHGKLSLEKE